MSRRRDNQAVSPHTLCNTLLYQNDTNKESDQVSIAMPLLENSTLNQIQEPEGPLDIQEPEGPLDPVVEEKLKQLFSMIDTENEPSEEFSELLQSAPVPEVSWLPYQLFSGLKNIC